MRHRMVMVGVSLMVIVFCPHCGKPIDYGYFVSLFRKPPKHDIGLILNLIFENPNIRTGDLYELYTHKMRKKYGAKNPLNPFNPQKHYRQFQNILHRLEKEGKIVGNLKNYGRYGRTHNWTVRWKLVICPYCATEIRWKRIDHLYVKCLNCGRKILRPLRKHQKVDKVLFVGKKIRKNP